MPRQRTRHRSTTSAMLAAGLEAAKPTLHEQLTTSLRVMVMQQNKHTPSAATAHLPPLNAPGTLPAGHNNALLPGVLASLIVVKPSPPPKSCTGRKFDHDIHVDLFQLSARVWAHLKKHETATSGNYDDHCNCQACTWPSLFLASSTSWLQRSGLGTLLH
jgi:hypothetical protein